MEVVADTEAATVVATTMLVGVATARGTERESEKTVPEATARGTERESEKVVPGVIARATEIEIERDRGTGVPAAVLLAVLVAKSAR
jgi:hypothetical protein